MLIPYYNDDGGDSNGSLSPDMIAKIEIANDEGHPLKHFVMAWDRDGRSYRLTRHSSRERTGYRLEDFIAIIEGKGCPENCCADELYKTLPRRVKSFNVRTHGSDSGLCTVVYSYCAIGKDGKDNPYIKALTPLPPNEASKCKAAFAYKLKKAYARWFNEQPEEVKDAFNAKLCERG